MDVDKLSQCSGSKWDEGNSDRSWIKHRASRSECEQVFFNVPLVVRGDPKHSQGENRYLALGLIDRGPGRFVALTVQKDTIRGISGRDVNRRERWIYDEEEDPEIRE